MGKTRKNRKPRKQKPFTIFLGEFFKIGKRKRKSTVPRKKPEKMLNLFFNPFYKIVRSFWYEESNPKYDSIRNMYIWEEWNQLFRSNLWASRFISRREKNIKGLYKLKNHKAQLTFGDCNFLMTHFSCLSTILQAYGRILSDETERSLESLFNYKCLDVHKEAGTSKYLWTLLITHFANLGEDEEAKRKRLENLDKIERFLDALERKNKEIHDQVVEENKNEGVHHQAVEKVPCNLQQCVAEIEASLTISDKSSGRFLEPNNGTLDNDENFDVGKYLVSDETLNYLS